MHQLRRRGTTLLALALLISGLISGCSSGPANTISMTNARGQTVAVPLPLYHLLGAAAADQVPVP